MPRLGGRGVNAALAGALAGAVLAGCQTDASIGCQLAQQVVFPGDELTLLREPRLDQVRDGFLLLGTDGSDMRWAAIDPASGQLGAAQAAPVDPAGDWLWYGMAGVSAPGDTVLAAVAKPAANGTDQEIRIVPWKADGSGPLPAGPVVATIAGGAVASPPPLVAMGSSRLGMVSGLAWVDPAHNVVMAAIVSGAGQVASGPFMLGAAPAFACLAFVPGKDELTLAYYMYLASTSGTPTLEIVELRENGSIDSRLQLNLERPDEGCPVLTATDADYAFAWQDSLGSWLGVYEGGSNRLFSYSFADAVTFGGPDLQPPLAGLGSVGSDYGVVVVTNAGAELWRLGAAGGRRPGALRFPSAQGDLGTVSSLPVGGSLYTTYADYSSMGGGVGGSGQRYLLKSTCF
jgi:hypothetical protein